MSFMDVYTTRHRRASGRLVHELNVCTVRVCGIMRVNSYMISCIVSVVLPVNNTSRSNTDVIQNGKKDRIGCNSYL